MKTQKNLFFSSTILVTCNPSTGLTNSPKLDTVRPLIHQLSVPAVKPSVKLPGYSSPRLFPDALLGLQAPCSAGSGSRRSFLCRTL